MVVLNTRSTRLLHFYGPPVAATLAAGAVMMLGGYLFHVDGWKVGGPVMTPAGPLISIAFALAGRGRATRATGERRTVLRRLRRLLLLLAGVPIPAGGVQPITAAAILALTLVAGLVMAVAGYAVAGWTPVLVPPLALLSGLIIFCAFFVGAHGRPAGPAVLDDEPPA